MALVWFSQNWASSDISEVFGKFTYNSPKIFWQLQGAFTKTKLISFGPYVKTVVRIFCRMDLTTG